MLFFFSSFFFFFSISVKISNRAIFSSCAVVLQEGSTIYILACICIYLLDLLHNTDTHFLCKRFLRFCSIDFHQPFKTDWFFLSNFIHIFFSFCWRHFRFWVIDVKNDYKMSVYPGNFSHTVKYISFKTLRDKRQDILDVSKLSIP